MNNPYYNGKGLSLGSAAMPQMQARRAEAFAQQDILRGAQASANALGGIGREAAKLMDYKADTTARDQLRAEGEDLQNKVRLGLEAAPGSASSILFEDGSVDEDKVNDLAEEYAERIRGIQPQFIDQGRATEWETERDLYVGNLARRIKGEADLHQLRGIRRVSEAALRGHIDSANWGGALAEVGRQEEAGVLSPMEAGVKRKEIERASATEELAVLIDNDPSRAAELLESGRYKDVFTYAQLRQFRKEVRNRLEEDTRGRAARAAETGDAGFLSAVGGDSKEAKSLREFMENSGTFTQQEINWRVRQFYGEDVFAEVQQAARNEAMAFDIDKPMQVQEEAFMKKYGMLGMPKEALNAIWKEAEEARASLTSVSIDAGSLLDKETMAGRTLLSAELWKEAQGHLAAKDKEGTPWSFVEGSYLRKDAALMELIGYKEGDRPKVIAAKYEDYMRKKIAERTRELILARYNQWRKTEGKEASPLTQYNTLRSIAKTITGGQVIGGSENITPQSQVDTEIANYDDNVAQQRKRREAWGAGELPDEAAVLNFRKDEQMTLRFDDQQKDKPVGILVPKAWLTQNRFGEVDMNSATVEATFDNKHYRVFKVVGTCDGDVPVMTHAVAVQGGWNPQGSYNASVRFMYGTMAPVIADRQQAAMEQARQNADYPAQQARNEALGKELGGLSAYRKTFEEVGQKYGLDPMLLMAIAIHETGRGSSPAFRNKNNAMGVSNESGPIAFGSVEESIEHMARALTRKDDKGEYTGAYKRWNESGRSLAVLQSIYAPTDRKLRNDPDGLNSHWLSNVSDYYRRLSGKNYK